MADNKDKKDQTNEEELDQTSEAEETSDAEASDETSEATDTEEASAQETSEVEEEDEETEEDAEEASADDADSEVEDEEEDEDDVFDEYLDEDEEDSEVEEDSIEEEDSEVEDEEEDSEVEEDDLDDEDLDEDELTQDDEEVEEDLGEAYANIDGLAAYFDDPNELMYAATKARDEGFDKWDAYSPFPIHGIEDAMGIGRSWLPWVTFAAGGTGFLLANLLQFGTLTFDWPMIIGGKPYAPWPSFVPIMFELTVLIGGVTTALVMLIASGCFRKPKIIDPEITNDRFVLWVSAEDSKFDPSYVKQFMEDLDPVEIRPITFD